MIGTRKLTKVTNFKIFTRHHLFEDNLTQLMLSNSTNRNYLKHKTRISIQRVLRFLLCYFFIFFFVAVCPAIVVGVSAGLANEGYGNQRL